jgi:hypothetical protein
MTFGTTVTDQELSRMAPIEQELARAFAAELGHTTPAEKPVCAMDTEVQIDLGLSDLGGIIRLDLEKLLDGRLLVQGTSAQARAGRCGVSSNRPMVPEGEFVSLAQHYDYPILDGSRLDTAALAIAAARAREHRLSVLLDLSQIGKPRCRPSLPLSAR